MTARRRTTAQPQLSTKDIGLKLKWLRQERKWSMNKLAERAGLAVSYVSKLESGGACPTVMTLQHLLAAMDVNIYEFFRHRPASDPSEQVVFRRAEMAVMHDDDRRWWVAFPRHPDIGVELTDEEYRPHTQITEKETFRGDICGLVVAGELTLEVVNRGVFTVRAGDAFYVKAGHLHAGRNDGDQLLRIVSVLQLAVPEGRPAGRPYRQSAAVGRRAKRAAAAVARSG